jgi:hypothetical protein
VSRRRQGDDARSEHHADNTSRRGGGQTFAITGTERRVDGQLIDDV